MTRQPDGIVQLSLEQHPVVGPPETRHLAEIGARVIQFEGVDDAAFIRDYDSSIGPNFEYPSSGWGTTPWEKTQLELYAICQMPASKTAADANSRLSMRVLMGAYVK